VSDYYYGVNLYVVDDENYEKFKNGQDFIYIYGVIETVARINNEKYCSNCGQKIKKETIFCEFCGSKQ